MHCPNCGKLLSDNNANFCEHCGKPVTQNSNTAPIYESVPHQSHIVTEAPKKSKTNRLIAILVVLTVIVVGVAAFLFAGPLKDSFGKEENISASHSDRSPEQTSESTTAKDTCKEDFVLTTEETTKASYVSGTTSPYDNTDADFLFHSDTERLTFEILDNFTQDQIRIIANEVYARHGYIFSDEQLNSYFSRRSWYHPRISSMSEVAELFSDLESANLSTINRYRESKGWK